ncbi:MAG: glycosyltransferase [Nitriliruptorales bacterium]|nr:glycosyltransferase [Nitriliruptorales bacterium]
MTPAPDVSIVVPTRNAIRTVERCLRSAGSQAGCVVEVIVVDNHSADGTHEIAARMADRVVTAGPERSAQRNRGTELARAPWILWIDADMILPARTAADSVRAAVGADAIAVFIDEVTEGEGYWTACRSLERECYRGVVTIESPRLVRREWLRAHPFDDRLSGTEDAVLRNAVLRDGRWTRSSSAPIVHDEGRLRLLAVARKRYYYGAGLRLYRTLDPGAASGQIAATLRAYRDNWRLLLADPVHALGLLVLRLTEVMAYAAAYLASAPPSNSENT